MSEHSSTIKDRLKAAKISVTPTRLSILEILAEEHKLWSIEQLIKALKNELKKKSKSTRGSLVFTTVYRCLLKMEAAKLVKSVDLGDGVSRYEFDSDEHEHHHHIICKQCESVEPLDHCEVLNIENKIKRMGYTQVAHRLEFFGICKPCSKKAA